MDFTPVDNWDETLEIVERSRRASDQVTERWQWENIVPGCYIVRRAHGLLAQARMVRGSNPVFVKEEERNALIEIQVRRITQ